MSNSLYMTIAAIRQKLMEIECLLVQLELGDVFKAPTYPPSWVNPRCDQCDQPIGTPCGTIACPHKYTVT